jgi:hypothetical protein
MDTEARGFLSGDGGHFGNISVIAIGRADSTT